MERVVVDVAVALELRHEGGVVSGIGESIDVEGLDVFDGRLERETEDAFEMRIGGGCRAANLTDVKAGADVLEQLLEDLRHPSSPGGYLLFFTGSGVGVLV